MKKREFLQQHAVVMLSQTMISLSNAMNQDLLSLMTPKIRTKMIDESIAMTEEMWEKLEQPSSQDVCDETEIYYFAVNADNDFSLLTSKEFTMIINGYLDFNWEEYYIVSPKTGKRILSPEKPGEEIEPYYP